LILVFIGISLIFKGRSSSWGLVSDETYNTDFIHSNAIFGGADHTITSQNFKGGETMALFGGVELDLRDAKLSPDGCKINATAIFGGVEITIPKEWKVVVKGTPIFGAVENKSRGSGGDPTQEVELHCTVVFGGIEIK
jgi:predicted membrane protein